MTNDEKVALALGALRDAFPRQEFPPASVAMYARQLRDLPGDMVLGAVERLIRRTAWLPSIAEIRREVADDEIDVPPAEVVWVAMSSDDPLTRRAAVANNAAAQAALVAIGSWAGIRYSERPEQTRRMFIETYRAHAEATLRDLAEKTRTTLGPTMQSLPVSTAAVLREIPS